MDCNYSLNTPDKCDREATDIILWGCLEQHVMEFVACAKHMHHWITEYHRGGISCAYCYGQAASYLTNQLIYIRSDFKIQLVS